MTLPIESILPELLSSLRQSPSAVLQAPPGAGKTTRVPLALLEEPWREKRKIILLEPRRLAARAAARFMASQLGEPVGQRVGYRTRLDSKVSRHTLIEVVTEGILTRMLQDDPSLEDYAAVIFDEFHERSLQADLGLALCLETQQALRPDLRLLVMSATLDAAPVARLLGDAPLLTSEGRSFPVEVRYCPPGKAAPWEPHLVALIQQALKDEPGSFLVFLPGAGEIRRIQQALEGQLPADTFVAPLYGDLSQEAQDAAIQPCGEGRRKLVLTTSIAETSLTIEGVRGVIDVGLQRLPSFDPVSGLSRLQTQRVSQASAEQRKGRAGRQQSGICYRLWSAAEQERLAPFTTPEILSADLCDLVLELANWGVLDPHQLIWLDPPPQSAWQQAQDLLRELDALDAGNRITDAGRAMAQIGLHPRLAHMLLQARQLGWATLGSQLAALLSERDVLVGQRHVDVQDRLLAIRGERGRGQPDRGRVQRVRASAQQLLQRLMMQGRLSEGAEVQSSSAKLQLPEAMPESADAAGILLAMAYPDRIAKRRTANQSRYLLSNGRGARLQDDDPLQSADFIVAAELDNEGREARVFLAAEISLAALNEHFSASIRTEHRAVWDEQSQVVQPRLQRRLGALVLEDKPSQEISREAVLEALLDALTQRDLQDLPWDTSARQWQARVQFLRRHLGGEWPDVSDSALAARLQDWVAPFAQGFTRMSQFRQFPMLDALQSLLDYDQQRQLNQLAPTHFQVPSGSQIRIDYDGEETPVLAVRLQEMFGLAETPAIGGGRVPLMLHLLSPAQRPVQVTRDLASFWRQTYSEVRKDLRGRYPKHHWPDDPLSAPPTRHAKRRGEPS